MICSTAYAAIDLLSHWAVAALDLFKPAPVIEHPGKTPVAKVYSIIASDVSQRLRMLPALMPRMLDFRLHSNSQTLALC